MAAARDAILIPFPASCDNDPNFGVRMVSAYDSTGNIGDQYASATLKGSGKTQDLQRQLGELAVRHRHDRDRCIRSRTFTLALLAVAGATAAIGSFRRKRRPVLRN